MDSVCISKKRFTQDRVMLPVILLRLRVGLLAVSFLYARRCATGVGLDLSLSLISKAFLERVYKVCYPFLTEQQSLHSHVELRLGAAYGEPAMTFLRPFFLTLRFVCN